MFALNRGKTTLAGLGVAAAAAAALAATGPDQAQGASCGTTGSEDAFMQHFNSAHLEKSPMEQVKDLMNVDSYTLAHTTLVESMLEPLLKGSSESEDVFVQHFNSAHLEKSPMQQVADLEKTDDYVLAHTVLVENMLKPLTGTCSDDGSDSGSSEMPGMDHGSTPAPAPAEPAPSSPAPAPAAGASAVTIKDYAYAPKDLSVPVGTTVTWTNQDDDGHTVTGGPLKSATFKKGGTYSYKFDKAGTFSYVCTIHPNMKGSVKVG